MTVKAVVSSLIYTLGCYLILILITIAGTVVWIAQILSKIPTSNHIENREIVKEFSTFLSSNSKDSIKLQKQANMTGESIPLQNFPEQIDTEPREWLAREDHRRIVDDVRACLRGEDNELLLTLLVVNYPREKWSTEDYDFSQRVMTKVRNQWDKINDTFKIAAREMEDVEICNSQRQTLEDVIASVSLAPSQ